jgi:uncharacterized protein YjiS (DUF1127 family)
MGATHEHDEPQHNEPSFASQVALEPSEKGLAEWRRRAHSRSELMNLSDADLRDIGLSRCSTEIEASKPFWMA